MTRYTYDHIHLRSRDPSGMADYFRRVFDAKLIESGQRDGPPRVDLDLDGLVVFIATVDPEADMPSSPREPHLGLDHFGLRVEDLDEAIAELKRRSADIIDGPRSVRPGTKIAFVMAPENVRIELVQRS